MRGVSLHIFLEVFLLYKPLNLFLELVKIISVVSLDYLELAPSTWIRARCVCLHSGQHRDVVQVKNLTLDLFTTNVQGRDVLHRFPTLLNIVLSLMGEV